LTETEVNILKVRQRIRTAKAELRRMPAFRVGTLFHTDRVRELESMQATLSRLEAIAVNGKSPKA
jgi:hypothetical protein